METAAAARTPHLTHVALFVADVESTKRFYLDYVGLHVVHERVDDGVKVVWLGESAVDPDFVIVAIGVPPQAEAGFPTRFAHFGFDLSSREAVDAIAARGRAAGLLMHGPADAGSIVGYYCMLRDPDGNLVEFSHGQPIRTRDLPAPAAGGASP